MIEIRALKYRDCLSVARLIKSLADKIGSTKLLTLIRSDLIKTKSDEPEEITEEKQKVYLDIGLQVLQLLIQYVEDDVNKWFASLIGVSEEELLEMPVDTPLLIIQQLSQAEEIDSFFTTALQLYRTMSGFGTRFSNLLTK